MPTHKLKHPITFGSETITELDLPDRLKAKHLRGVKLADVTKGDMGEVIKLVGQVAAQPPKVVDELSAEDLFDVLEVITGFLPAGPEIGPTP